jgi:hypothetical protein
MYSKLMLNTLKVIDNFILSIRHLVQRRFSKNLEPTCGPCSPVCELRVNYKWTKCERELHLKWIKNELKDNWKWIENKLRIKYKFITNYEWTPCCWHMWHIL